jgi:hypothetical protein
MGHSEIKHNSPSTMTPYGGNNLVAPTDASPSSSFNGHANGGRTDGYAYANVGGSSGGGGSSFYENPPCRAVDSDSSTSRDRTMPAAANSVRSVHFDVEVLVLGGRGDKVVDDDPCGGGMLGRMVKGMGKECIVRTAILLVACKDDAQQLLKGGTRISFNRYNGIQEWKVSFFLYLFLFSFLPNDDPLIIVSVDTLLFSTHTPISFLSPVRPTLFSLLSLPYQNRIPSSCGSTLAHPKL